MVVRPNHPQMIIKNETHWLWGLVIERQTRMNLEILSTMVGLAT